MQVFESATNSTEQSHASLQEQSLKETSARLYFDKPTEQAEQSRVLSFLDLLNGAAERGLPERGLRSADKANAADVITGFKALLRSVGAKQQDRITIEELQKSIGDPSITGTQAQMLALFKARLEKFVELDPPSDPNAEKRISLAAIQKFHELQKQVKEGKTNDENSIAFVNEVDDLMKDMRQVLKDTSRKLYADEKEPVSSVKMECVKQGPIGNCYFYGAVGAVLAADPSAITRLIKEEADGTYTVRFPGKRAVNVKAPSDAEIFLFPKPGKDGVWMWVLEKAYGQYCMNDKFCQQWRKMLGREQTHVAQENTEGPSLFDDGLKFLTGKSIEWTFNLKPENMISQLELLASENPKRPITADASFNVKVGKGAPVWGHTYSVISYNKDTATIVLRNPWGSSPPDNANVKDLGDGKFSMSAAEFCQYFNRISYPKK